MDLNVREATKFLGFPKISSRESFEVQATGKVVFKLDARLRI